MKNAVAGPFVMALTLDVHFEEAPENDCCEKIIQNLLSHGRPFGGGALGSGGAGA
ncbi:hypothetical protein JCM17846_06670 [Iodidimonas nitroreducens]|uniref:Uncharacterized protein n=1 Tax=Iodidimonas nitroreducens TaxID=1236968 RepID=A0A5A7N5Q9_9PROT|nr:hypothetical protein [Iodidimonas nitroreducens]GER02985.1 hypothetical protein JCM17846_06670 [Iodidimonas nitroreducens]